MKRLSTIFVLVVFMLALFGSLFSMAHASSHGYICLASQLNGFESPCPETDPLGFAGFHGGAIKKMSNLVIFEGVNLIYAVGFIALLFLVFLNSRSYSGITAIRSVSSVGLDLGLANSRMTASLYWFSLHENSPAFD